MPVRDAGACGFKVQESLRPVNARCFEQRENYSINKIPKQVINNSKGLLLVRNPAILSKKFRGILGALQLAEQINPAVSGSMYLSYGCYENIPFLATR
jgi:hypothetical protein